MSGNKVTVKNKSKDEKSKSSKSVAKPADDEEIDFSVIRKPIQTSTSGVAQVLKVHELATEELRNLLHDECDLIYECKVCRNMFRSLVNFVSHKRAYCVEQYKNSVHGNFFKAASVAKEVLKVLNAEQAYQESLLPNDNDNNEKLERIPMSKDLTEVIENLVKARGVVNKPKSNSQQVLLQKIPNSSVAVFQNLDVDPNEADSMRTQVMEVDNILSSDKAFLQRDGSFKVQSAEVDGQENVIQISDEEEFFDAKLLKCNICDLQFSTRKTLRFHMKYKHLDTRLVFPCPDCLEIFSTSWSVYRHLFKVHRKTAAQIRRLRESIQAKAFKMNNPPAFYEKKKNMKPVPKLTTEEERIDHENQLWMDGIECSGDTARCFGCGLRFERRAALQAHTAACAQRSRVLSQPKKNEIRVQIRKDYNKGPAANVNATAKGDNDSKESQNTPSKSQEDIDGGENDTEETTNDVEIIKMEDDSQAKEDNSKKTLDHNLNIKSNLPHDQINEMSNLAALKQKMHADVDFTKLMCKKCDIDHKSILDLYNHMASHYKWVRYSCKLCNHKNYDFEKVLEHVRLVHKLKGDNEFYCSTVKAIDGAQALELMENEELNEEGAESRRPSRCSSDSSRQSEESSGSFRVEGSRKRKAFLGNNKPKRHKEENDDNKDDEIQTAFGVRISGYFDKVHDENSSDVDDLEDTRARKQASDPGSRRSGRKRVKTKKHQDFEYDLSNLLKLEAQGYREAQAQQNTGASLAKPNLIKKKTSLDASDNDAVSEFVKKAEPSKSDIIYTTIDGRIYGPLKNDNTPKSENLGIKIDKITNSLDTLSKKAVSKSKAVLKMKEFIEAREGNTKLLETFTRPIAPRTFLRADRPSPRKENFTLLKENPLLPQVISFPNSSFEEDTSKTEAITTSEVISENVDKLREVVVNDTRKEVDIHMNKTEASEKTDKPIDEADKSIDKTNKSIDKSDKSIDKSDKSIDKSDKSIDKTDKPVQENPEQNKNEKASHLSIPTIMPINYKRQGLEVVRNPLVSKNIKDLAKAGMKTKILVIKPINRNKDGTSSSMNTTNMKIQTIKLRDPVNQSELVVKVPKVEVIRQAELNMDINSCPDKAMNCLENINCPDKITNSIEHPSNCFEKTTLETTNAQSNEKVVNEVIKENKSNCNQIIEESFTDNPSTLVVNESIAETESI